MLTKHNLLKIIFTGGGVYFLLCLYLFLFQNSFLYFPQTLSTKEFTSAKTILQYKTLTSEDYTLLQGWEKASPKTTHTVLYFGGNAEEVSNSLYILSQISDKYTFVSYNYRGYGKSQGIPNELSLKKDALFTYDQLAKTSSGVTVIGRSLGTGIASYVAANRTPKKLILITPYDSILSLAKDKFSIFPVSYILQDTYDTLQLSHQINVPTLMLSASNDLVVPKSSTLTLQRSWQGSILKEIPHSSHASIMDAPDLLTEIRAFLDKQ